MKNLKNHIEIITVIIFFSAFLLSLLKPIDDIDLFFHLKTGEYIWQNKTLPDKNPFPYAAETSQDKPPERASFLLKQYWLAQLIMYGFYQIGGFYGIVALRCLIYFGIGLILYYWMGNIKNSSNSLSSSNSSKSSFKLSRMSRLVFLIPVVYVYLSNKWPGIRPNHLSFLFSVVVVYLLERQVKAKAEVKADKQAKVKAEVKKKNLNLNLNLNLFLLPLFMLLWANMHGGFILGDVIIVLYITAAVIKAVYNRGKAEVESKENLNLNLFLLVCLIAILISFVNPNTYKVINIIYESTGSKYSVLPVLEHLSPFYYISTGRYSYLIFICLMIVPFLLRVKRFRLNVILLLVFLSFISLKGVRYIPFLVFIATPFIAEVWGGFIDKAFKRIEKLYLPVLVVFTFVIFFVSSSMRFTIFKNDIISSFFPAKAVEFIKTERPEGEIFNDFNFGGYLIWSLYPDYKIFIDGRKLYNEAMEQKYIFTISGITTDMDGIPLWKHILNTGRAKIALISPVNPFEGGFIPLVRRLVEDNEWRLVLTDTKALLFLKDTGKNREIIKKYSIPKLVAYGKALDMAEIYKINNPDDWRVYTTLGEINLYMGKPKTALLNFESALKLNPSLQSTYVMELIDGLRAGKDYTRLRDEIFR